MYSFMNRILLLFIIASYSISSNEDFKNMDGDNGQNEYFNEINPISPPGSPTVNLPPQLMIPKLDLEQMNKKIKDISLKQQEETSEAFYLNREIPSDDYYDDLGEFIQSEENVKLIKTILGEYHDELEPAIINGVPYLVIDGIEDGYCIREGGREYTLKSVKVTDAKKVFDDLFFEYNAKYLGNDGKEIFCSEGPIPARYCGKQVEIFGKRYNVYEIFGNEVIHIAGSLLALLPISTH